MNATVTLDRPAPSALSAEVDRACSRIAPTWPLDRFIAVNPYWGRIESPFHIVSNHLMQMVGTGLTMPMAYYNEIWQRGDISLDDLRRALSEAGQSGQEQGAIAALTAAADSSATLPLLSDALDSKRDIEHAPAWRDAITQQVTQFCAAYFDRDQADWHLGHQQSIYASWRQGMIDDHSIALLMDAPEVRRRANRLPQQADEVIEWALSQLQVDAHDTTLLLELVLLRINGWAAWCAYQRWQARLAGGDDSTITELLAIRLAWECLLDDGSRDPQSVHALWRKSWTGHTRGSGSGNADTAGAASIWQRAHEIAYQRPLVAALAGNAWKSSTELPSFHAVFCIDVRSEVFRRALETVAPTATTAGFAGFFGLPISYTPIGTNATRPQLPGLLAAAIDTTESSGDAALDQQLAEGRYVRLRNINSWRPFGRLPNSAFALVESLGLGYLGKIIYRSLPGLVQPPTPTPLGLSATEADKLRPQLRMPAESVAERTKLAKSILSAMSLTSGFGRLVLLIGHGSQTANNPHAAGLDCGACCGQTGEVNARVLAGLLNDTAIRSGLVANGIVIPESTHFLAGLHNTTLDEVTLFDLDLIPDTHQRDLQQVTNALQQAGARAR